MIIRVIGKGRLAGFLCMACMLAAAVVIGFDHTRPHRNDRAVTVNAEPLRLSGGWGYQIEVNHKLYIYQDQIPCIAGKHLFPSRQQAMAVAGIVVNKIEKGQSPAVKKEELEQILSPGR